MVFVDVAMFRLLILLTFLLLALLLVLVLYTPHYLNYADKPAKADAVVLFVGPDYRVRMREARSLIAEGYADCLIIPAYGQLLAMKGATNGSGDDQDGTQAAELTMEKLKADIQRMRGRSPQYLRYYENTRIEALEARLIMDRHGFRSALFVSSPIHMRRIRLIAGEVFAPAHYHIAFIPARFEQRPECFRKFTPTQVAGVALECVKIIWFQTYRLWPANS
jgi:hypothetical protein